MLSRPGMNAMLRLFAALFVFLGVGVGLRVDAAAETACTPQMLAEVVDQTAAAIRDLNAKSEADYAQRLNAVARAKGWDETRRRRYASLDYDDPKLDEFNTQIETLFSQIDELSRARGGTVTCQQVDKLKSLRDRLLVVMAQKSGYMLAQLDAAPAQTEARKDAPSATPQARPQPLPDAPQGTPPPTGTGARDDTDRLASRWSAEVDRAPLPPLGAGSGEVDAQPQLPVDIIPSAPDESYSIEEIREAGRGLFGTISAEFAGVLNAIFRSYGRPNGYIVGREGGGAFLAGLRFGKGKLNRKGEDRRQVFWQGPSIGYDFGAEGSSVIILVYNLKSTDDIYGRFSGIGGSAYMAGGVGFNALTNGKVIILPVRVGIGLRLGASISYLKITDQRTWNPF